MPHASAMLEEHACRLDAEVFHDLESPRSALHTTMRELASYQKARSFDEASPRSGPASVGARAARTLSQAATVVIYGHGHLAATVEI